MKLDSNKYARSILQEDAGERCFVCGREHVDLVRHEIYEGVGRRAKCKKLGLWITVCPSCHASIHSNPKGQTAKFLDEYGERTALAYYNWEVSDFVRELGKNYLEGLG